VYEYDSLHGSLIYARALIKIGAKLV